VAVGRQIAPSVVDEFLLKAERGHTMPPNIAGRVLRKFKHRPDRRLSDEFAEQLVLQPLEGSRSRRDGRNMADALARARAGDSDAFRELTDPYRRELHVHCYRILGSFQDAEDLLQETLLSAWQALDRFDGRSSRAWLYRIATNRCLNYLRDTSRRPKVGTVPESGSPYAEAIPSDEPSWLEPYPDALMVDVALGPEARYDARESIALSFVAGLQSMPAQQRWSSGTCSGSQRSRSLRCWSPLQRR
jgi:RNA polymerase sigma factor (sigma-70 family)